MRALVFVWAVVPFAFGCSGGQCHTESGERCAPARAETPAEGVYDPHASEPATSAPGSSEPGEPPAEESHEPLTELRPGTDACATDADCVPASCCHAEACVARANAPSCADTMCTMECRGGTMDCGGGCACHEGRCAARVVTQIR